MLRELRDEGVDYIPVDKALSTARWMPVQRNGQKVLLGPLSNIIGIGPKGVDEIIQVRNGNTNGELGAALKKKLDGCKTFIDTLEPIKTRLDQLYPAGLQEANIVSTPKPIKQVQTNGGWQRDVLIIGVLRKMNLRDENEIVNIARRGYKYTDGDVTSLLMFFKDDTDEIYVKITRHKFERMGREVFERGRVGKAIYAIKGYVSPDFRGLYPERIKYLGDMKESMAPERGGTRDTSEDNTGIAQGA